HRAPAPRDAHRLSAKFRPAAALLLLFVYYGAYMAVILLGGLVSDEDHIGVLFLAAAAVVAPLCATYVGLVRYAAEEPTGTALRLGRPVWTRILLAVVAGAALAPLAIELRVLMQQL